jgi:hypothetical protein
MKTRKKYTSQLGTLTAILEPSPDIAGISAPPERSELSKLDREYLKLIEGMRKAGVLSEKDYRVTINTKS